MSADNSQKQDLKEIVFKMQSWCGYQERCQRDVRDKLYELGLRGDEMEAVISSLISENFINEERFALAFAGGKFRIKRWGRIKIKTMLKLKGISDYSIKKALNEINGDEYYAVLEKTIDAKRRLLKSETNKIRRNYKLLKFAQSRGFETDIALEIINREE